MVDGVKEGMSKDGTMNINNASRENLMRLPGITDREADRTIAGRRFDKTHDLVSNRITSQSEYDKIHDRITAAH